MRNVPRNELRILAIDPMHQGVGFAVLERPVGLVDWGWREIASDKNRATLRRVRELLDRFAPDVLVIEDYAAEGSRRGRRVKQLARRLEKLAGEKGIEFSEVSPKTLEEAFAPLEARTKCEIARAVAQRFPELARSLPPIRKPWMSEGGPMSMFDATALAMAFYCREEEDSLAA